MVALWNLLIRPKKCRVHHNQNQYKYEVELSSRVDNIDPMTRFLVEIRRFVNYNQFSPFDCLKKYAVAHLYVPIVAQIALKR
jgi:hypothetical protein